MTVCVSLYLPFSFVDTVSCFFSFFFLYLPFVMLLYSSIVTVPARFKQLDKHENLTGHNGSSLELSCTAFGDQPLSIQWMREVSSPSSSFHASRSLSSSSSSPSASSSPSFELMLLPPASSSPGSSSSSVQSSSSLESRGGGETRRIRFLEKRSRESLTSQLILLNARREDSRMFQCMASNEFGSDVRQIRVRVEEIPDAPTDLQLDYKTSRSVCIRWTPGFDGNSDILEYVVTIREEREEDPEASSFSSRRETTSSSFLNLINTTVSGNQTATTTVIRNLLPSRRYVMSVHAKNRVGLSSASHPPLSVITDEEAPGGPPSNVRLVAIDATTIKVSRECVSERRVRERERTSFLLQCR